MEEYNSSYYMDRLYDWTEAEYLRWKMSLPPALEKTMMSVEDVWEYLFRGGDELSTEDLIELVEELNLS